LEEKFELYGFADILHDTLDIYKHACKKQNKIDFEDLLQIQCAIHHGCAAFITQDKEICKLDLEFAGDSAVNTTDSIMFIRPIFTIC
jgi:predicted nucleic acid-binding protein